MHIGSDDGLGQNRGQAITWNNDAFVYVRIHVSPGPGEFMKHAWTFCSAFMKYITPFVFIVCIYKAWGWISGIYFGTPDVLFGMTLYKWYRWWRWCWRRWGADGHDKRLTSEPFPVQMQIGKEHLSLSTLVGYKFIHQMCWYFLT